MPPSLWRPILLLSGLLVKVAMTDEGIFAGQPRILIDNGHLVLEAGQDKNITFKTKGSGTLNFVGGTEGVGGEGQNFLLSDFGSDAGQQQLEERLARIEQSVNADPGFAVRMRSMDQRIQQLMSHHDGEDSSSTAESIRTLQDNVRRLSATVAQISEMLGRDECAGVNPCRNGGTCVDTYRGFFCRCPDNWEGQTCEADVDECARFAGTDLGCQNGASCQNLPGTYRCHCPPNFYGVHCTQRSNDCSSGSGRELCGHGACINSNNGYTCICEQGWKTDGINPGCVVDVNECESASPPCSTNPMVTCINSPGSFRCGHCPAGYTGNGYYCTDVDECLVNNGGCSLSPRVQCINTIGSRSCGECPAGYQGNGAHCIFLGPCHVNNGGCSPMAVCLATAGMVQCFCRPGYQGEGVGPMGCLPGGGSSGGGGPVLPSGQGGVILSPCASGPCQNGATCFPLATSFMCNCAPGYTGVTCQLETNECDSNPCLNNGTCIDQFNGYRCQCGSNYEGVNCQDESQECGGTYQFNQGSIDFPRGDGVTYNHNMNCLYVIKVQDGKVVNLTFTQFNLEQSRACQYDWLQIHDGPDQRSPVQGRYCGNTLPGNNGMISSTHNAVLLHFVSDSSLSHNGFHLTWNATTPVCGSIIRDLTHGSVQSPGYPGQYPHSRDCTWTIYADLGKRIQFHFATIRIESHANCSYDYVEVWDGSWMVPNKHLLGRFCNSTSPPPITSSSNIASLIFHSDNSLSDAGFHITWAAVPGIPGCGGLFTDPTAEFASPSHPETYSSDLDCEYVIRVPPGDRVKISFVAFDVEHHGNCNFDYVEVRDGGRPDSPLVGRYCGNTIPPEYASSGNQVFLKFRTDSSVQHGGFRLRYETACGGQYTTPNGIISSPYHPNPYPRDRQCEFIIAQSPGTVIHLEFMDFDIEGSYDCSYDYLEIRDGDNENSTLIGRFCGDPTLIPAPIDSQLNYLWFRFASDGSVQNRGFKLNYTTSAALCGGILKDDNGVIRSPADPVRYPHGTTCTWIIQANPGNIIRLTWLSFALEQCNSCSCDSISVYDNNTIPNSGGLIGKYCGTQTPPQMTSTSERMSIVFATDSSVAHDGFTASYVVLDSSTVCGGNYYTSTGVLHSPGWPRNYGHNRECTWVLQVPTGQQIMLNFTVFNLENHTNCNYDYLEIRNGGYMTSPLIGRFCGNQIPATIPSFSNQLYLKFASDNSLSAQGFEVFWDGTATGCGGLLTSPSGSLTSPSYPLPYHHRAECLWEIRVSQGSKIQLLLIDVDLEAHSTCNYDYIEIRDGSTPTSPSLGRFCHSNSASSITTTGSDMFIKFRSDYSQAGRGFHVRYFTVCNNEVTGHSGVIESPNFPLPYPHNRDCLWTIKAPRGNKVNITFSHFDIEESRMRNGSLLCRFDFVQVLESANNEPTTADSDRTSLGKFCGRTLSGSLDLPGPFATTKQFAFVRFLSDVSVAHNGFRLEWTVNGCGGNLRKTTGRISSPDYPNAYPVSVECIWYITVDLGSSVELNVLEYDLEGEAECAYDSLSVYGGPDLTSPRLTQLCQRRSTNVTVTSTGNNMLVRFVSDGSIRGKGFLAEYKTISTGCGGRMTARSGIITSPNYPNMYDNHDDCAWLIQVDRNHVVTFTFEDFDVEPHSNCSYDYVALFDGANSSAPLIIQHCGQNVPNPNVFTSTGNQMYVRLKADGTIPAKGFKANYTWGCGARIVTEGSGDITSPNYPHSWEGGGNCSWVIIGARETDRVTLTLSHLDLHWWSSTIDSNCTRYFLAVRDGIDVDAPLMGQYCTNAVPPTLTSSGNAMYIHLQSAPHSSSGVGFRALYSVENSACGGELTSETGLFTSPNFPDSYPGGVECTWSIGGSPGNRVSLQFTSFDLEQSEHCNRDYVEVHENGPEGRVIGHYCGNSLPANLTVANKLWIKFNSDTANTGNGFIAQYNLVHGNELSGPSGEIASPMFPLTYFTANRVSGQEVTWRITVSEGMNVLISFDIFEVEPSPYSQQECFSTITIFNGYDTDSPVLYRGCGLTNPASIASNGNVVFLKLTLRDGGEGSRFKLRWMESPTGTGTSASAGSTAGPADINRIFVQANDSITIRNPGYPGYENNMNVEWLLESPPNTKIQIRFVSLVMESTWQCRADYVELLDGVYGLPNWNSTGRYCRRSQASGVIVSSGNIMKIRFVTDASQTRNGFRLTARAVCGGYVMARQGILTSPDYPANYGRSLDCEWIVRMRPGRKMQFELTNLNIRSDDAQCAQDYMMLRNGASDTSPFILMNPAQGAHQNGRLCLTTLPSVRRRNTTSNVLHIAFHSNDDTISGSGFRLRFSELSFGCGGSIQLSRNVAEANISSPNFPTVPPAHSECIWVILAPAGKKVQLDFVEQFYLSPSSGCRNEGVELRDGGTDNSDLINAFCREKPSTQKSTGNIMYIRYYTTSDNPNIGFKATVKIATCGGTSYVSRQSVLQIESPGHPSHYANNLDCQWKIVGPAGHYLSFTVQELDLPPASNCSATDYIQIQEQNATDLVLGTFCGSTIPAPVDTYANEATLIFRSDGTNQEKTGFIVRVNASVEECGGELEASSGILESPGYPNGYPHHHICRWLIRGPEGRSVRLEFEDFDLEPPVVTGDRTRCRFDYVAVESGEASPNTASTYPFPGYRCGSQLPVPTSSNGNIMSITLKTDGSISHRGFRARWSTDEPALCGGPVTGTSGVIRPPMTGPNYSNDLVCDWTFRSPMNINSTTVFKMDRILIEGTGGASGCPYDFLSFYTGGDRVRTFCAHTTTKTVIGSPLSLTHVIFKSDQGDADKGFNLTYSYSNCGGVLGGPVNTIMSPRASAVVRDYPPNVDCVWLLRFNEGEQIELSFSNFNLESSADCNKDYLLVRNGGSSQSPILWRGCGDNSQRPATITSMTNQLWVEFHSDETVQSTGFSLTATAHTMGCGGVLHGASGNITSPRGGGGGTKYPDGVECVWEIRADPGFHAIIEFYNRFDVEMATQCQNDYVQVMEMELRANDQRWRNTGNRLCGREIPQTVTTMSETNRIKFVSNNDINGDGFSIYWHLECGEVFNGSSDGEFTSPGYPQQYQNNMQCDYVIASPPQDFVTVEFVDPFELERNDQCRYDSVTATEIATNAVKGKYCGSNLPPSVSTRGPMKLTFSSDSSRTFRGFRARFSRHQCGGNITDEVVVESPVHPNQYFHDTNCTWVITAPPGKVVEIKFSYLELEISSACQYDFVAAYEGPFAGDGNSSSQQLGRYCGNHTVAPPVLKSRDNVMTLVFRTDRTIAARGFRAFVRFTYGASSGCGGVVNLRGSPQAQQTIQSLDVNRDGFYEPDLNCQWLVLGRDGQNVRLAFSRFDVERSQNETDITCWDYVEIRDGDGPFSPLIGLYCGTAIPAAVTSSRSFLWIKFFSDFTTHKAGFVAVVANVDPVCGSHQVLNVTNQTQIITSPNFPGNYPNSVRCRWVLEAPVDERVHIKFLDFSVERSERCVNDFMSVEDVNTELPVSNAGENSSLVVSSYRSYHFENRWRRRLLHQKVDSCGTELPHDFFSLGEAITITFASDAQTSSRGFRLEYSAASCNRTYEGLNGRILSPRWPERIRAGTQCVFTIQAPPGKAISLYFGVFGISGGPNCTDASLEIRDGSGPASALIASLCGHSLPQPIYSSGNNLWFSMRLGRFSAPGFDISYATTEQGQIQGCGGTLFNTRGVVTSPGFPGNYSRMSDCSWTLKVPLGQRIEVRFTALAFGSQENCDSDYLEVYDLLPPLNSRQLVSRYCGNDQPAEHMGASNTVQLHYVTSVRNAGGWRAQFQFALQQGVGGSIPNSGMSHS